MARVAALLLISIALVLGTPAASEPPLIGSAAGYAAYQVVVGEPVSVDLRIGNFNGPVNLILKFSGPGNWLHDHTSVAVGPIELSGTGCQVEPGELDCRAATARPPYTAEPVTGWWVTLTGLPTHAGVFAYTLQAWNQEGDSLEPIDWPDREPLVVSWVERVIASN